MTTLKDILYADESRARPSEDIWLELVRGVADGDPRRLHSLYRQIHRIVFTLIVRITANRDTADELTLDVFSDVWRSAAAYDPAAGSVAAWIMNQARGRAVDRLRLARSRKGLPTDARTSGPTSDMVDFLQGCLFEEQGRLLCYALEFLSAEERRAIETTFFSEFTFEEAAAKLRQSPEAVEACIRSGLLKLRDALRWHNGEPAAHRREHWDAVSLFALQALPASEVAAADAQIASCGDCRQELDTLRPIVRSFAGWPTDLLRPAESLAPRLAERIAAETGAPIFVPAPEPRAERPWREAAPGIHVQILADNAATYTVSMLVRLDPHVDYPGHAHAGVEELHLLHGVLSVDEKTLFPGDFLRSEPGSVDERVATETGCTCFLMTSTNDSLL